MKKKMSFEEKFLRIAFFIQFVPAGFNFLCFLQAVLKNDKLKLVYYLIYLIYAVFAMIGLLANRSRVRRLKELDFEEKKIYGIKDDDLDIDPKLKLQKSLWGRCKSFYYINLLMVWTMYNTWLFFPWVVSMLLIFILLLCCHDKIFGEKFKV